MVEGRVLCALAERVNAKKRKRCIEIEEKAIEGGDVCIFLSKDFRIFVNVDDRATVQI